MTYVQRISASPIRINSFFIQTLDRGILTLFCWETPSSTDSTKSFISSSLLYPALFWWSLLSRSAKIMITSNFPWRVNEARPMPHSSPPLLHFSATPLALSWSVCVSPSVWHISTGISPHFVALTQPPPRGYAQTANPLPQLSNIWRHLEGKTFNIDPAYMKIAQPWNSVWLCWWRHISQEKPFHTNNTSILKSIAYP